MEPMTTAAIVGLSLKTISSVLEMFPNYDQKKTKEYYKLKERYETEKNKPRSQGPEGRSNRTLLNLRDSCLLYGETIIKDLRLSKG